MIPKHDTISKADLARLLQLSEATLNRYIKADLLPRPLADRDTLFSRRAVAEAIGVNNLDEPFIMAEEASKILGISVSQTRSLCQAKHAPLPHYKFIHRRGCAYFFRVSELQDFQSIKFIKSSQNKVYQEKRQLLNQVFDQVVDTAMSCGYLSAKQAELLKDSIIHDKSLTELASQNGFCHENARQYLIKGRTRLLKWLEYFKAHVRELSERNGALEKENYRLRQLVSQLKSGTK